MIVTRLEKLDKKKTRVFLDEECAFVLYPQDLRLYKLEEDMEISEQFYERIMAETIIRRAKQKAMVLLKKSDRTEKELRQKLKWSDYPQRAIDEAIEYVKSYGYINDTRYLENYIYYKKGNKSLRMIELELQKKGLSREEIRMQLERDAVTDEEAIQRAIQKKLGTRTELSLEERQKTAAYLYRKGFREQDIKKYFWNALKE